ncbi:hypothetical protein BDN67DRAFT_1004252 [Paxillus ammoniavirescens]|nr:hypothetical protein BDN67DRAFT_1004252 [Paxillus ammoniavirescens]
MAVCYLIPIPGSKWNAWYSLFTFLELLNDFPDQVTWISQDRFFAKSTVEYGAWEEGRRQEVELVNGDPTIIVIGAGHTGREFAARFEYIGIPHMVVDKNARVGNSPETKLLLVGLTRFTCML